MHYTHWLRCKQPQDRELVEVYAQKLGVDFPTALADAATIAGGGAFGDVHNVPTVAVLDAARPIGVAASRRRQGIGNPRRDARQLVL